LPAFYTASAPVLKVKVYAEDVAEAIAFLGRPAFPEVDREHHQRRRRRSAAYPQLTCSKRRCNRLSRVDRVTKRFGGHHPRSADVSFTMAPGDGRRTRRGNGAGKSTIKNLLAGIVKPDSGSVIVNLGSRSPAMRATHATSAWRPFIKSSACFRR